VKVAMPQSRGVKPPRKAMRFGRVLSIGFLSPAALRRGGTHTLRKESDRIILTVKYSLFVVIERAIIPHELSMGKYFAVDKIKFSRLQNSVFMIAILSIHDCEI
jgi:hypothetical protein